MNLEYALIIFKIFLDLKYALVHLKICVMYLLLSMSKCLYVLNKCDILIYLEITLVFSYYPPGRFGVLHYTLGLPNPLAYENKASTIIVKRSYIHESSMEE